MTPNELVSITANNLGDGGFVILNREEHIGFVNDVGHDIWMASKAVHQLRQYDLPANERTFILPDTDIVEFAEIQVRQGPAPQQRLPEPEILNPEETPIHEQEKPVHQNISEGGGVYTNVGNIVRHYHLTPEFRNGEYRFFSPIPFEENMKLHLHCVIYSPRYSWIGSMDYIDPTTGLDPQGNTFEENLETSLWEPLRNVYTEGTLWRAARRTLNFTRSQKHRDIWKSSQDLYFSKYLPDAIHYIHSIKDATTALHVSPFKYLVEPPL